MPSPPCLVWLNGPQFDLNLLPIGQAAVVVELDRLAVSVATNGRGHSLVPLFVLARIAEHGFHIERSESVLRNALMVTLGSSVPIKAHQSSRAA
jgi:hypothetical protein